MSEVKGTKALELWCKRLVRDCPNVQIDNMTTSWRNGMAFCALVHHFRPDLIDLSKLDPQNIYENNQLAYSIAEKHLGIPALLDPEDMVENDVPDRLSVLTYLSQFYQRLGHTVNTKVSESESKSSPSSQTTTPIKFGKVALDKCAACGHPVYLAQRLIVSQKLYHRQCFRCSKCSGHLNPKNFHVINETEFSCDTCKNEKNISKYLNNNDQMGMLAFSVDICSPSKEMSNDDLSITRDKTRPKSILEKINMFEKNIDRDNSIETKLGNINFKDNSNNSKYKDIVSDNNISSTSAKTEEDGVIQSALSLKDVNEDKLLKKENELLYRSSPEKVYKSNIEKFNFLQTQLIEDVNFDCKEKEKERNYPDDLTIVPKDIIISSNEIRNNITDDIRLAQSINETTDTELVNNHSHSDLDISIEKDKEIKINVPPRRKKISGVNKKDESVGKVNTNKSYDGYPENLNPFSDDEDEDELRQTQGRVSTNPFGSSDEEEDEVPPIPPTKMPEVQSSTPIKRHITAHNPFWSDGEEPSSDEDDDNTSNMHKSPITASTPNLPSNTPLRKKPKAPPPPIIRVDHQDMPSTSMDDVASLSSMSSHTSTVHSDQKSFGKLTPNLKKKRCAPTPPDSLSTSHCGETLDRSADTLSAQTNLSDGSRRAKGPAPGLPLPERRSVKLQMSGEELQTQLDLLETQQLGLERQGVLIERMIRDKCEGDEASTAPQEEIEDLVIQLCELVNEKNDLFRKQTELMFIRRQQRLEQEQADIEHEIRVLQSRPAVNRIDADKAREEQLVCRLVEIVRMRDELVQQIDAERRRERQEDLAIAASIASKRAQRNSDSNSSSIKSADVVTPVKKNKVKDKVKKQLKKAKHTLIAKKKDDEKKDKTT